MFVWGLFPNNAACCAEDCRNGQPLSDIQYLKTSARGDPVELWIYKEQVILLAVKHCTLKDQT